MCKLCNIYTPCKIYKYFTNDLLRDINLTEAESPTASKIAPNGNPYTSLIFVDFNSMYLWSQQQDMPLSPGLEWTLVNGKFKKNVLIPNSSFSSIQWLYFQQTQHNETIHHAYHQGEKIIHGYKVDGYAIINGQKTVFEYNGCYFHGCPCLKDRTDEQIAKYDEWIKRKTKLEAKGCKVISTSCCQWKPFLRRLKNPKPTLMGRILLQDDQEQFYTACNFLHKV